METRQRLEIARSVLEDFSQGDNPTLDYYISEVINMLDGIIAHHESIESKGADWITESLEAIKELKHE